MSKIWTYGISNFDVVTQPVKDWPKPGELVLTDKTEFLPGGPAINTAITLRKLGYSDVGLIARFGSDRAGSILIRELQQVNIDTGLISVSETSPTAVCIVCVHPGGERSFLYSFGGNNELAPGDVDSSRIHSGDIFHLGAAMGTAKSRADLIVPLLTKLQRKEVKITVDTSFDPFGEWWPSLAPCLPYTDILFSNESEAKYLTGFDDPAAAAQKFNQSGAKAVVIKLGSKGAYIYSAEFTGYLDAFPVQALDSTGAGDAFCGGFLFGLERNWPIAQCGIFANAVGGLCVMAFGATTGIKSYQDTVEFIQAYDFTKKWIWRMA